MATTPRIGRCPECGYLVELPCRRCSTLAELTKQVERTLNPKRRKSSHVALRTRLAMLAERFHAGNYKGIKFDNLEPVTVNAMPEGCECFAVEAADRYSIVEGGAL